MCSHSPIITGSNNLQEIITCFTRCACGWNRRWSTSNIVNTNYIEFILCVWTQATDNIKHCNYATYFTECLKLLFISYISISSISFLSFSFFCTKCTYMQYLREYGEKRKEMKIFYSNNMLLNHTMMIYIPLKFLNRIVSIHFFFCFFSPRSLFLHSQRNRTLYIHIIIYRKMCRCF